MVLVTLRVPLYEAAFHAMRNELPDLMNLFLDISVAIFLGKETYSEMHQIVVLGKRRRPVCTCAQVITRPFFDEVDNSNFGLI